MLIEPKRFKERLIVYARSLEDAWKDSCVPCVGSIVNWMYCVEVRIDEIPSIENRYAVLITWIQRFERKHG